jgi:hypothetical protein
MVISLKKAEEKIFAGYLMLAGLFIVTALGVQLFFVYLMLSGQEDRASQISHEVEWKIDGTFKNNPDNIWYEEPVKK